jgi:hypothetical protein
MIESIATCPPSPAPKNHDVHDTSRSVFSPRSTFTVRNAWHPLTSINTIDTPLHDFTDPPPQPPHHIPAVSTEASDLSWDDAAAGGPAPGADDALAGMAPFENFILGILTNFSAVALDRLHNLLRVFVVGEPKYEGRSQEQLGAFLAHLVAQGKVKVDAAGVYRRKKG